MRSTSAGSGSSWWKWGIPVTILAILAAVLGGLAARRLDAAPAPPSTPAAPIPGVPEPGPLAVEVTPGAAQHPDSAKVSQVLREYFAAINSKQYDQWTKTVVASRVRELPRDAWLAAYSSTKDGSVRVDGIESAGVALQVLSSFTSVQDVSQAPPQLQAPCVRWRVVFRMVLESGALRLDGTLPGSVAVDPC